MDYEALVPIYDRLGMSLFATEITPRLLTYAQQNEWLGRRILDLGCGTGESMFWFSQHGYNATGVDSSPRFLDLTRAKIGENLSCTFLEQDIHNLDSVGGIDMALALDVMNEMDSLRDLGTVFTSVHGTLSSGKWFIFDLHTVEGLTTAGRAGDQLLANEDDLSVLASSDYDFERQMQTTRYVVFQQDDGGWQRQTARRIRRGYPIQAVATLLRRSGFEVRAITNDRFVTLDPGAPGTMRVIFITVKVDN